jgi:RimJ/RimL family protein N-acetyltransferase
MKHDITVTHNGIKIRPVCEGDLENLRKWRNDKELTIFLTPLPDVTSEQQKAWFLHDCATDNTYTFAVESDSLLVGSVPIYNINGNTAEFGRFLLCKESHGKGIGKITTELVLNIAKEKLGLKKVYADVEQKNIAALITY